MRRLLLGLVVLPVLGLSIGLLIPRHPARAEDCAHSKTVVLHVDGVTCTLCKRAVEKALGSVAGVEQSDVDPSTGRAVVTVGRDVHPDALAATLKATGYPAQLLEVR